MSRVSYVKPHLSEAQVKDKIATAPTARCQQKWMIIHNALIDPRPASEIAKHTATSLRTVHQVIADYNRVGASTIHPRAKLAKSPRSYLSLEQEATFLNSFNDSAVNGELTTTQAIQSGFESQVGSRLPPV